MNILRPALTSLLIFCAVCNVSAQSGWEWQPLPAMPEPVANNAVVEGFSGDSLCVYSFAGIGSGLEPADIHLKAWRYNSVSEEWMTLPDVPDEQGKIAAGASLVNGIIYVIGGYYVESNFSEESSDDVHRFDPQTNTWLSDGANIPVPIDDQVQAVWRDSLIFVVTGWSDTDNVPDVQIYNPELDAWSVGTPVPANNDFEAFGASGTIIGDTIYYFGGVQAGFSFSANNKLRKGVINPADPTDITWSLLPEGPVEDGYRMAATSSGDEIFWIGGASTAYNFDALAYSNNAPVEPLEQIRLYDALVQTWEVFESEPQANMDFRGVARGDNESWYLAGGIDNNREVSDALFKLHRLVVGLEDRPALDLRHGQSGSRFWFDFGETIQSDVAVFDLTGQLVYSERMSGHRFILNGDRMNPGMFIVQFHAEDGRSARVKVVVH